MLFSLRTRGGGRGMGEASMASAYVFNCGNQSVSIYINQGAAGSISGTGVAQGYEPTSANYPFNPSGGGEAAEFNAQTRVGVETAIGGVQYYQVNASEVPPGQDIQLYLFPAHAVLCWGFGDEVLTPSG
jgi:hypothetical protein